ncbi:MAG: hypothetical protein PUC65_10725 [Clostridiales bacterium]|nr:hypothetical protein [Clostridiales bacterium]
MRKSFNHILGIVIFTCILCGCSRLKEIKEVSQDPNSILILQTVYNSSDNIQSYILEVYNENKNLVQSLTYSIDKELIHHTDYIYDDNECLKDVQEFNKANELQMVLQYEYDEKGRILQEHQFNNENVELYSYYYVYDEKGYLTDKNKIYPEDIISEQSYFTHYEYYEDGTLMSENSYEGVGDTYITNTVKYIYENGMLVRKEWYDCVGDTFTEKIRSIYTYDDQNRLLRVDDYCGKVLEGYTVYSYDVEEKW